MSLRVSALRDFLRPDTIERWSADWGVDCTPRALAPEWADPESPYVGCSRNGARVDDWDAQLADGDCVHYWMRPGIAIPVGSAALAALGNAVLFSVYGYLIQSVIAPARKPPEPGDDSSQTYAYGQGRNPRGDGLPIPVVYGRVRFPPPVINEYVRSFIDGDGNAQSEYVALLLIGEGPIHAIGDKTADGGPFSGVDLPDGLEINNQPAKDFDGVEAHVRLGNADQDPITEFADPVLSFDVDQTLEEPDALTPATAPGVPAISGTTAEATAGTATGVGAPTDTNITKWDTDGQIVSYVAGDDADEFTVVYEFPQGLVRYNSVGDIQPNSAIFQIRYRQVDGGGTPFGNYVVLPAQQFTLSRPGPVRVEARHRFFQAGDGSGSYAPPGFGFYVDNQTGAWGTNPGLRYTALSSAYDPGDPAELKFSFATWIKLKTQQPINSTYRILDWYDDANDEGFRLNVLRQGTGNTIVRLVVGDGTQTFINLDGGLSFPISTDTTGWHQVAFTWEGNYDGTGLDRVRFFLDGSMRNEVVTSRDPIIDTSQPIRLMSDSHTSPTLGMHAQMDETSLWERALSPFEIASMYNGNAPSGVSANATGLLIGARMDNQSGSSPNIGTDAFGPYASSIVDDRWILGSGTNAGADPDISVALGHVRTPESGNEVRGKYRIEVKRIDTVDTSFNAFNEATVKFVQLRTFQQFEYPTMALLAVKIPGDQIKEAPLITARVDGRLVPVWDGQNLIYPHYDPTYSRNPAWVTVDALTSQDFGLGSVWSGRDIDLSQFQAFADFCDELIHDNLDRGQIVEAAYLDSASEAVAFDGTDLGSVYGDVVRYKLASLPTNFPGVTATATGAYVWPELTGLSGAPPTWLTDQAALTAQEVVFVEYRQSDSHFYLYTRTTQDLSSGQTVYTPSSGSDESNGLEVHDVRYRFDGVFDRADFRAWDAIIQMMNVGRGAPMRIGSRLSAFIDTTGEPVALLGMGNIVEGSWRQGYMGVQDRPNAESSDFLDELLNYERVPISDEHPDVTNPANQSSFRWRRVSLEGVTRRGHAKRHLRRDLNVFKLVRRWCEFELGIDSLPLVPGDLLAISHDTPQYGYSGRLHTTDSVTSIKLDRQVVLEGGKTYQVQIEDAATRDRETRTVTSSAGTKAAGTAITVSPAFTFLPEKDFKYALGETTLGDSKVFRLVQTSFDPVTMRTKCRCVEYDAQVYSDDFGVLPSNGVSALPIPTAPTVPPGVLNLQANEVTTRSPDGSVSTGVSVSFFHMSETYSGVGGADVYVASGAHQTGTFGRAQHKTRLAASATSVTVAHPFAQGQTYTIYVVPFSKDGRTAALAHASWVEFTPNGLAEPPQPPLNPTATMAGDHVVYSWGDGGDLDQARTVEARAGGWILGIPVGSWPAQARSSGAVRNWASGDANAAGIGAVPIYFRAKLGTGQYSDTSEITAFEPEPGELEDRVLSNIYEAGNFI